MVKLIRLQGDSDSSETEIRNVFNDSIMIPPNSKLGLRSCRVNFLNIEDFETYRLPTDTQVQVKWAGGDALEQTIIIKGGVYQSTNALYTELQKQMNATLSNIPAANPETQYRGFHATVTSVSSRTNVNMFKAGLSSAGFGLGDLNWDRQGDTDGTIVGGNGTLSNAANNPDIITLTSTNYIPLIGSLIAFRMAVVPTSGKWELIAKPQTTSVADANYKPWAVEIETDAGGDYRYALYINNVKYLHTTGVPRNADTIRLFKYGNNVKLIITPTDTAANPTLTLTTGETNAGVTPTNIPVLDTRSLTDQLIQYQFKIAPNTQFDLVNVNWTNIVPLAASGTPRGDVIQLFMTFPRANPLGSFLGFTDEFYSAIGQPAIIKSDQSPLGTSTYPGIMVRISIPGLDLDSYAGRQDRQNQSLSYLDVILPQSLDIVSNLIYEPNNMALLDLKNVRPIELRNINIQFARDDTGEPLSFMGQPMVLLVLDN